MNATEISRDERMWAMLCHLSALSYVFTGIGVILGPLLVWLIKKEGMPFVDEQGKESLNFQITIFIAVIVSAILSIVLIGLLLLGIVGVYHLVMVIVASVKANDGIHYRYPLTLRLIK